MRYEIWKNGKLISEASRMTTVMKRLREMSQKFNPQNDKIWVTDTTTWESESIEEFIPTAS